MCERVCELLVEKVSKVLSFILGRVWLTESFESSC